MAPMHKVIIVGGSVAGLTLANALERASIDYILLERGEYCPPWGASIVIGGSGARILDQLGLFESLCEVGEKFSSNTVAYEDGKVVRSMPVFSEVEKKLGYPLVALERTELLRVLYSGIQDKSKCIANAHANAFHEDENGVTVTCADGTSYTGEILVGADGIHSKVREFLFDQLAARSQNMKDFVDKERKGMSSNFSCVFGIANPVEGLRAGDVQTIFGNSRSTLIIVGKNDRVFYFLFEKTETFYSPNIPRYTKEEATNSTVAFEDVVIKNGITMKQVFANNEFCTKVSLEEHMQACRFSDRTCLIGDSLHKMTPNDGLGGIMAMESAASLVSAINKYLVRSGPTPVEQIKRVFAQYTAQREKRLKEVISSSGTTTRAHAGANLLYPPLLLPFMTDLRNISYQVARTIIVRLPEFYFVKKITSVHVNGPSIDFLARPKRERVDTFSDEVETTTVF